MNRRGFLRALISAAAAPIVARVPPLPAVEAYDLVTGAKPLFGDVEMTIQELWSASAFTPTMMYVSEAGYEQIRKMTEQASQSLMEEVDKAIYLGEEQ